jgi:glycosyltransferase involved in cell wall biosynthesis
MTATVIIPTTGSKELRDAIESVLNQTYPTQCYVVADGKESTGRVSAIVSDYAGNKNLHVAYLPINVGANGFYGHRVYAAFTHLVNTDYVLYLDQDNWFDANHVKTCVDTIEKDNLDWSYSLRAIVDKDKKNLAFDNCESLGRWPVFSNDYHHIDTNCYCVKTSVAIRLANAWHGGWGQDRAWFQTLSQYFPMYNTTGKYTVNYRIGGNEGSVKKEFFDYGNKIMNERYNGEFPWAKV